MSSLQRDGEFLKKGKVCNYYKKPWHKISECVHSKCRQCHHATSSTSSSIDEHNKLLTLEGVQEIIQSSLAVALFATDFLGNQIFYMVFGFRGHASLTIQLVYSNHHIRMTDDGPISISSTGILSSTSFNLHNVPFFSKISCQVSTLFLSITWLITITMFPFLMIDILYRTMKGHE